MKIRSNISNCVIHFMKIHPHAGSDNCCAYIYFLIFLRKKKKAVTFATYLRDMKNPKLSTTTHKETFLCKRCGETMCFDFRAVVHRKYIGRLKLLYQSGCTQQKNSSSQCYCIQKASQECSSSLSGTILPKHRQHNRDENSKQQIIIVLHLEKYLSPIVR